MLGRELRSLPNFYFRSAEREKATENVSQEADKMSREKYTSAYPNILEHKSPQGAADSVLGST